VKYGAAWEGVPEPYRNLPFPEMPIPATRALWEQNRPEIRKILLECLGDMPPRPNPVRARTLECEKRAGYTVEKVEIENGVDAAIPAYLGIPEGLKRPAPAGYLWRQAFNARQAGATMLKIAMFDEVNEGTAVFKIAPTRADAPEQGFWLTLDADGIKLPGDWYLRLSGWITEAFREKKQLPAAVPRP
jgi:hypothetical protein